MPSAQPGLTTTTATAAPRGRSAWRYWAAVAIAIVIGWGVGSMAGWWGGPQAAKHDGAGATPVTPTPATAAAPAAVPTSSKPTGMLGAKWLMTPEELKAAKPDAIESKPGTWAEDREAFGRPAHVEYVFAGGGLASVVVRFKGDSSDVTFSKTESDLEQIYGRLAPVAPPTSKNGMAFRRVSEKEWEGVRLRHMLGSASDVDVELLMMYRPGGGGQ